jgi:hypothetical protein
LASTNPGKKNIRGETPWLALIPLQPVPKPANAAATATSLTTERTLTNAIILANGGLAKTIFGEGIPYK